MPDKVSQPRWTQLAAASALALHIHGEQLRKGTSTPYVSHLFAVTAIVLEHAGDEDQACAAMLHDAIEDGGAKWEQIIEQQFGERVARIVRACTDADTLPKPPWRERKEAYLAALEHKDGDALLVSAADKLHNAGSIVVDLRAHGPAMFSRFNAGREGTLWYYGAVSTVLSKRLPGQLTSALATSVEKIKILAYASDH